MAPEVVVTTKYFATSSGNVSLMTAESRELPWQPRMPADAANLASWCNTYLLIFFTVFGHSLPIISTLVLSSMSKCGVSICCVQYVICYPICYLCSVLYCCRIARWWHRLILNRVVKAVTCTGFESLRHVCKQYKLFKKTLFPTFRSRLSNNTTILTKDAADF